MKKLNPKLLSNNDFNEWSFSHKRVNISEKETSLIKKYFNDKENIIYGEKLITYGYVSYRLIIYTNENSVSSGRFEKVIECHKFDDEWYIVRYLKSHSPNNYGEWFKEHYYLCDQMDELKELLKSI